MSGYLHHETRRKIAHGARSSYRPNWREEHRRMRRGPYLEQVDKGVAIVIPSEWYNEKAIEAWKSADFTFNEEDGKKSWVRSCSLPFDPRDGKGPRLFTPEAWRKWARRKYYDLWRSTILTTGSLISKNEFVRQRVEHKEE